MEEEKRNEYENKHPEKPYKGFTNLSAYEEIFPIVIQTIQILQSYKRENKQGEFDELFDKTKEKAVSILTYSAGNGISESSEVFSVAGGDGLTQEASGLKVTADGIGDTQLEYDTGQALTTTSDVTFRNITVQNITLGNDHSIEDNSTCVIIRGSTSILYVC